MSNLDNIEYRYDKHDEEDTIRTLCCRSIYHWFHRGQDPHRSPTTTSNLHWQSICNISGCWQFVQISDIFKIVNIVFTKNPMGLNCLGLPVINRWSINTNTVNVAIFDKPFCRIFVNTLEKKSITNKSNVFI